MSRLTHGMSNSKEFKIWKGIKSRCYTPSSSSFKNYGAKGITVCKRWKTSFENFYADMGPCPEDFSIERINNKKGYSKSNCKWASRTEQNLNKSNTIRLKFNNKILTIPEWSKLLGISANTLYRRYYRGWTNKRILTTQIKGEN